MKEHFAEFQYLKKYIAEFFGTFAMVFVGTGAMVVNDWSNGAVSHVGVSLAWGLVVIAMILAIGDISGAHLNPAVSIAFAMAGRFPWREVPRYISGQVLGAVLASILLNILFVFTTLGETVPRGSEFRSFVLETFLTCLLMFVILRVSTRAKLIGFYPSIAVGIVIFLDSLFAGPICGASMNPARSLAPALITGHLGTLWIYIVAPVFGALLAVVGCRCIQGDGCCLPIEISATPTANS